MLKIEFKKTAVKDLDKLEKKAAIAILNKIKKMEDGLTGDIKKLTNFTPEYRLRVGNYRILFELESDEIIVYRIKHRKESYRKGG